MEDDDVLLQRLEEQDADCARVAAENAVLWEEVQALRTVERERDRLWNALYAMVNNGSIHAGEWLPSDSAIDEAVNVLDAVDGGV